MADADARKRNARENCAELIKVDKEDGVLKVEVDGEMVAALPGGYVSTELGEDEVYVYVSAWFCAKNVELQGPDDGQG